MLTLAVHILKFSVPCATHCTNNSLYIYYPNPYQQLTTILTTLQSSNYPQFTNEKTEAHKRNLSEVTQLVSSRNSNSGLFEVLAGAYKALWNFAPSYLLQIYLTPSTIPIHSSPTTLVPYLALKCSKLIPTLRPSKVFFPYALGKLFPWICAWLSPSHYSNTTCSHKPSITLL